MIRLSILLSLLTCILCPGGVVGFSIESSIPTVQDLGTHLQLVQQVASSALSTHANLHTVPIDLPHSISSISSANNLLAVTSNVAPSATDIASSLLKDYRNALDAEPLKIKIITGCLLAIVGDAIAQSGQPEDYNKKRAAAFVAFDGVWRTVQQVTYGPIIQTCNGKFSTSLLGLLPLSKIQDAILKEENVIFLGAIEQTLVSQLVLIPLLYYPIFYSVTGVVQRLTVEETIIRAKETFVPLMKRNLLFWIPVQFCAFYFVEEELQIPVLTACGLIWTVILSFSAGNVNSSSEDEKDIAFDGDVVEKKMILEVGESRGVVGLTKNFFNAGLNGAINSETSEDSTAGTSTTRFTKTTVEDKA